MGNSKIGNFLKCWYFEKNDVSVIFDICTESAFLILSREGPRLHACRFAMFNIGLRNWSDERFQGFVCLTRQSDLVTPSAMMMNYRNSVEAAGVSTSRLFSGGDSLGDVRVVVYH